MQRNGVQRLEAIPAAIERRDDFRTRVIEADGDAVRCADLMAEAIAMKIEANGFEIVGRDGRATVCIEDITSSHCLIAARDAYMRARGSNNG